MGGIFASSSSSFSSAGSNSNKSASTAPAGETQGIRHGTVCRAGFSRAQRAKARPRARPPLRVGRALSKHVQKSCLVVHQAMLLQPALEAARLSLCGHNTRFCDDQPKGLELLIRQALHFRALLAFTLQLLLRLEPRLSLCDSRRRVRHGAAREHPFPPGRCWSSS